LLVKEHGVVAYVPLHRHRQAVPRPAWARPEKARTPLSTPASASAPLPS
jgi:hypothetical protein